jgi:type IV pilus assembly protein PilC
MAGGMRTFEYAVVGPGGKKVTGRIEASSESAVAARLRELNLVPTAIDEVAGTGLNKEISLGGKKVKPADVAMVTRQLATMVRAGLPLPRALNVLVEQSESPALTEVLRDLNAEVGGGASLGEAVDRHASVFPPVMRALISSGEVGGFLDAALAQAAAGMESDLKLRRTIKGAMVYPVVVLGIAVLAAAVMLLFIVPIFQDIFESLDTELPAITLALVWLSDVLKVALIPLIAAGAAFAWWWRKHRQDVAVREAVEPRLLRAPLVGPLMTKLAVARFTRNLSTMVGCGVPLARALEVVGPTSGNIVVEQAATRAGESVRGGESFADALDRIEVLPRLVVQMVTVGEDAGDLDGMLRHVADFYDDEVMKGTESLTSALEPLLLVVIGVIVGGMLLALYMPMLTVTSNM